MKPIVLIDGSSYFFRAFHALPPLVNTKGMPTGAIYGVANMVRRLIKDLSPEELVVVFDTASPTFREELYPQYKAHRPATPPELSVQFLPLIELLKCMGVPMIMAEGVEADDVIGTLTQEAVAQGKKVMISTSDKDFAQLVNEHVVLLNTMTNQQLDAAGVKEKFGVWPEQIIDYLALMGDSVDNVPGVSKCGPKTAVKWLQAYGSLEQLMARSHEISGKIGECLRDSLPYLPLSQQLVTIKTDVTLPIQLSECVLQPINTEALKIVLLELEFKSWLKEIRESSEDSVPALQEKRHGYHVLQDEQAWSNFLTQLKQAKWMSLEIQVVRMPFWKNALIGIAFAMQPHEAYYLPLQHQTAAPQLPMSRVLAELKPILENPEQLKLGHNLKNAQVILEESGIFLQGMAYDVMLESYLLNSGAMRHDLETLAIKYLHDHPLTTADLMKQGAKKIAFDEITIEAATNFSAGNADLILQLHDCLDPLLSEGQRRVLHQIEMPLVSVLAQMERTGVLIDQSILIAQGNALKARMTLLEEEAYQLAGRRFNLQSPAQLQSILFEEHGLPVVEKTPKGQPSTAESALQELAYTYRLPALILEYRRLCKLVSTYIDVLPKRVNPVTGRVHTTFNQAITATGRLSSSEPNLQNIPIRSEEGRAIRRAFIAEEGYCLVSADYSQVELRIMAHLSQDNRLLHAFKENLDVHTATAAEILGIAVEAVDVEQRRRAKAVNFGLLYGMSPFGLSRQLGIERQEAERYVKTYFERYPGVLSYIDKIRQQVYECEYVETLYGRRMYLPEIRSQNIQRKKAAERMAINAPMQGTAAEIIKLAMIELWQWLQGPGKGKAKMVLQVHDELLFEVRRTCVDEVKQVICEKMERVVALSVPLVVSIGVGESWEEAH